MSCLIVVFGLTWSSLLNIFYFSTEIYVVFFYKKIKMYLFHTISIISSTSTTIVLAWDVAITEQDKSDYCVFHLLECYHLYITTQSNPDINQHHKMINWIFIELSNIVINPTKFVITFYTVDTAYIFIMNDKQYQISNAV